MTHYFAMMIFFSEKVKSSLRGKLRRDFVRSFPKQSPGVMSQVGRDCFETLTHFPFLFLAMTIMVTL